MASHEESELKIKEISEKTVKEGSPANCSADDKHVIFNLKELSFIGLVMEAGQIDLDTLLTDVLEEEDIPVICYNMLKALKC